MNSPVARSVQMNGRFTGGVYVDRVVANEMGVAKERLQVILREARADMELTASKDDISIIEEAECKVINFIPFKVQLA